MKQRVLNQVAVQDYYREHFLIFPVDTQGDVEIRDFSGAKIKGKDFATRNMAGPATPAFVFYDLQGRRLVRFSGKTEDAQEFLLLGRYVVEGAYRHTSFSRFKREHRER
jgi:thioredoxin-related protein